MAVQTEAPGGVTGPQQAGGRARTPAQASQLSTLCSLYHRGLQKILTQKADQYNDLKDVKKSLSYWPKASSPGVTNGFKKIQEFGEATAEQFLSFITDRIDRGAF